MIELTYPANTSQRSPSGVPLSAGTGSTGRGIGSEAGQITLRFTPAAPAGARLRFHNHRLLALGPALAGLSEAQAPALVRRLLPVCGWAQGVACLSALEAATGRVVDPGTHAARALLLAAESAASQIWRAALDWPAVLGTAPDLASVRDARTALRALIAALWPDGGVLDPAAKALPPQVAMGPSQALAELLDRAVLAGAPAGTTSMAAWVGRSHAARARMVRSAAEQWPQGDLPAVTAVPKAEWFAARLAADPAFCQTPERDGTAAEFGAIATLTAPDHAFCAGFGPVGGRIVAMLMQARANAANLRAASRPTGADVVGGPGWGAAVVPTMRGPLAHRLRLESGHIAAFGSVAPTEWLLHPKGALSASLAALPAHNFTRDARLALAAFDPCAPVTIEIEDETHA